MNWATYLLAISSQMAEAVHFVTGAAMLLVAVAFFIACLGMLLNEKERNREEAKEISIKIRPVLITAVVVFLASMLIPNRQALIESYFMSEGAKIVNTPNAEKTMTEITKRVDRFIEAIENK